MFDILSSKYDAVMEKVVDNEELMKCMRSDPVIYFHCSKHFKIVWKEKNAWKEIASALGIDIALAQTR